MLAKICRLCKLTVAIANDSWYDDNVWIYTSGYKYHQLDLTDEHVHFNCDVILMMSPPCLGLSEISTLNHTHQLQVFVLLTSIDQRFLTISGSGWWWRWRQPEHQQLRLCRWLADQKEAPTDTGERGEWGMVDVWHHSEPNMPQELTASAAYVLTI